MSDASDIILYNRGTQEQCNAPLHFTQDTTIWKAHLYKSSRMSYETPSDVMRFDGGTQELHTQYSTLQMTQDGETQELHTPNDTRHH